MDWCGVGSLQHEDVCVNVTLFYIYFAVTLCILTVCVVKFCAINETIVFRFGEMIQQHRCFAIDEANTGAYDDNTSSSNNKAYSEKERQDPVGWKYVEDVA